MAKEGNLVCEYCGVSYENPNDYYDHLKIIHSINYYARGKHMEKIEELLHTNNKNKNKKHDLKKG